MFDWIVIAWHAPYDNGPSIDYYVVEWRCSGPAASVLGSFPIDGEYGVNLFLCTSERGFAVNETLRTNYVHVGEHGCDAFTCSFNATGLVQARPCISISISISVSISLRLVPSTRPASSRPCS